MEPNSKIDSKTQKILNLVPWRIEEKFSHKLTNSSIGQNKIILSDKIRGMIFYSKDTNTIYSVVRLSWNEYKIYANTIKDLLREADIQTDWEEIRQTIIW